jgi:hypothetical protein
MSAPGPTTEQLLRNRKSPRRCGNCRTAWTMGKGQCVRVCDNRHSANYRQCLRPSDTGCEHWQPFDWLTEGREI